MKKILFSLLILFLTLNFLGQELQVKWGEKFIYDNKLDGFFREFIGTNTNYVYAKLNKLAYGGRYSNSKLKLVSFDKNTMRKIGEANLLEPAEKNIKKRMEYYQTIILENLIYVLWTKNAGNVIEIYAETFDNKLKKINGLKKIYEINSYSRATDNLLIVYNGKIGNKILIGREIASTKESENLKIEYKLINEDFSLVSSNQVSLPIIITKKSRKDNSSDLICSYELANDGYLYIKDIVRVSDEDKKFLKKGEASTYPILMQLNPESGKIKYFSLKFNNKNTLGFSWVVTHNTVRMYGFFSDLDRDSDGKDSHGMFYMSVNSEDFIHADPKFSYFETSFLNKLYNRKEKSKDEFSKNRKTSQSNEDGIDENYVIENVITENKNTVLFCTILRNWAQTVCGKTCQTYYYCSKRNVTVFKFNEAGEIVWASNINRYKEYSGLDVQDISVLSSNSNYFVTYGNSNTDESNDADTKSNKTMNPFEYTVFDGKSGEYKKKSLIINELGTKSKEAKYISPAKLWIYDNRMYSEYNSTKYKPSIWFSCICPPLYTLFTYTGNFKRGTGYMATITPAN